VSDFTRIIKLSCENRVLDRDTSSIKRFSSVHVERSVALAIAGRDDRDDQDRSIDVTPSPARDIELSSEPRSILRGSPNAERKFARSQIQSEQPDPTRMAETCPTSSRRRRSDAYSRFLVKRRYSARDADLRSSLAILVAADFIGHPSVIPLALPPCRSASRPSRCGALRRVFLTVFPPLARSSLFTFFYGAGCSPPSAVALAVVPYIISFSLHRLFYFLFPHRGVPAVADRSFLSRENGISSLATFARFPVTLSCATSPSLRNRL